MKRVLKICADVWVNASRDKRELTVCRELGAETVVMAKDPLGSSFRKETVDGFPVCCLSTRPLGGPQWLAPLNRVLSLFTWSREARRIQADVISGHDLPGLFIGYLSNLGNPHKAKLVYDSHEFELGRNAKRSRFQVWLIKHLERFLIKRCAFSIMVNDSIADEVQRIHALKERPVVARNVPFYWELDPEETARVRERFCRELHLPEDTFLVMYHGGIVQGRGIEIVLQAVAQIPDTAAILLGNALKADYFASLHDLCADLGIQDRVLFLPAVSVEELRNYVGAADIDLVLFQPVAQSHVFVLPNKFFESIQSCTPMIVSNFPEMRNVVQEYGIGLLVNPEDVEETAAAIRRMRDGKNFYNVCKEHLKRAKEALCWEREKAALAEAYRRILK